MADFWIKVEKSTPDKSEIFEIAEILGIDPDAVLGKLIRVWCWADSNSENGHIKSVTSVLIDRVTMSEGFADAMKTVGWLSDGEIPNFDRHLGKSAKKRANDAERKRMSRKSSEECHAKVVTESGLDKSRVDKITNTSVPSVGAQDEKPQFNETDMKFAEWMLNIIREKIENFKQPNLKSWAKTIRLMREQDNRDYREMSDTWLWCRDDDFWSTNVLSADKFRKQYDTLSAKSQATPSGVFQ